MIVLSFLFLTLRIAQLIFALIVLGISAHIASTWSEVAASSSSAPAVPSQVTWILICAALALLSVIYLELVPKFAPSASHPYASIILETTNSMCFFTGSVALAAFLASLPAESSSSCPFTPTAPGEESSWSMGCINIAAAAAAAALGAIESLLWAMSAFLTVKDMFKLKHPRINLSRKISVFSAHKEKLGPRQSV